MTEKQARGIVLAIIVLVMVYLVPKFIGVQGGGKAEKVRKQIEKSLLKKYGEEFIVDRIGIRKAYKDKFYQARIYPKSKLKNGIRDKYYEGSASVDIGLFGMLDKESGDDYSYINRNDDTEKYLLPKVKEIFGNRVRLKVDVAHEVTGDGSWWAGYKSKSLKEVRDRIKKDPKHNRILLTLYIYIFDKIDNEEEKEKRRKEIYEMINYLKEEGLFKYLEMGVIFIDERVLAPSYRKYKREIFITPDEKVKVEGETVYLPPMKLREEMSNKLGAEVKKMSEEDLIKRMNSIIKGSLSHKGINKYNAQYISEVYSEGKVKVRYSSWLDNGYKLKKYDKLKDIGYERVLDYIYVNNNKK
ncbi:hypothetical protein [Haliovirga abyssi]|uniref:Uncharacterized protein n=1 Tax=Haliovirga abyssi TaxID=2996794 RepID=A0AAU9D7S2_9FUSO|nr:hypothetical protein [Haliovirga abyssi]BDU50613.1 hypothetical protein HLVA_11820 [Haliovirga abyssi]